MSVAASIEMYAISIPGKFPCRQKEQAFMGSYPSDYGKRYMNYHRVGDSIGRDGVCVCVRDE